MCPRLLCCALGARPTLQHRLKTELSTPKTLQHLKPHPLMLPFTCEKPGTGISPFPAANPSVWGGWHSLEPTVFCPAGKCTKSLSFGQDRGTDLSAWHRKRVRCQRGFKQDVGTCKVLLLLGGLGEGAQEEILALDLFLPGPAASGFLPWQGGGRAAAELPQDSPGPGQ